MSQFMTNSETHKRERIVFEMIKKNPDLHHNALLKLIVPEFMAKTTFEKTRNSLLEKEIISITIKKNMKFYQLTNFFEHKFYQHIELSTNTLFHDLKLKISRLNTEYSHKDIDEKIIMTTSLFRQLFQSDTGFTFLDSVKNPKKTLYRDEHLTIQQLTQKILEVIKNDDDFEIVFPTVMSSIGITMPRKF